MKQRLRKTSKKKEKFSTFQKCPKLFPKVSKRDLNMFWSDLFFEKKRFPVFHRGSSLRKFSKKNRKNFKIPKLLKFAPKSVQTCFEQVIRQKFGNRFFPSVPSRVESWNFFEKNQKSFKFPKLSKIVPTSNQTCFEHVLGQSF